MKNRLSSRYPTSAELYAYEATARRLRAQEMSRLFRAAVRALKSLFSSRRVSSHSQRISHA